MAERAEPTRAGGAALIALSLTVILLPFTAGFPLTDDPYPHFRGVPLADLAAAVLVLAALPLAYRRARAGRLGIGVAVWGLLIAIMIVSFAVHPSVLGAQILLRLAGVGAAAIVVAALGPDERVLVTLYLAAVTLLEILVAWVQVAVGHPLGLPGEVPEPLPVRAGVPLPRGTLWVAYVLTALGMTCAGIVLRHAVRSSHPLRWIALAGALIQPVGMTQSRAAVLGFAAAVAALAWPARSDARYRWAIVALLLGAAIPTFLLRDAWLLKAEPENVGSIGNRLTIVGQSEDLLGTDPLFGVGPGNYYAAALARFPEGTLVQSVHNVTLLVAAEGGAIAGVSSVVLLAALLWSAWRGGPAAMALFFLFLPFMLFDALPYVSAQGAVILGLWIGAIDATGWTVGEIPPRRLPGRASVAHALRPPAPGRAPDGVRELEGP
jgi:hypothetical protein